MSGCGEDVFMGEDGAVHTENVVTFLDVLAPPVIFDVSLEFGAEWTVVPAAIKTAVDFCGLKDEALTLTEGYDFFHFLRIGVVFISHDDDWFKFSV
jgi:hypothetical protein